MKERVKELEQKIKDMEKEKALKWKEIADATSQTDDTEVSNFVLRLSAR